MQDLPFPAKVSFDKLCQTEASYSVSLESGHFPRLEAACAKVASMVNVNFRFYIDMQGMRTIEGNISAVLTFICQRCGREFDQEITGKFLSTPDEQKAKSLKIDEKLDIVDLEEDGSFDLISFLEDCLLLEIPFITSHEEGDKDCVQPDGDWSFGKIETSDKDNPFAQLASLKDSLKK